MSDSTHVGPIVFSNPKARAQLIEEGEVITFRAGDRTTGKTWWRESRTGKKEGDCTVEEIEACTPYDESLRPHWEKSGFDSVMDWQEAINDYHGKLPEGHLYRVTSGHDNGQPECAICEEQIGDAEESSPHPERVAHDECAEYDGTDVLPDGGTTESNPTSQSEKRRLKGARNERHAVSVLTMASWKASRIDCAGTNNDPFHFIDVLGMPEAGSDRPVKAVQVKTNSFPPQAQSKYGARAAVRDAENVDLEVWVREDRFGWHIYEFKTSGWVETLTIESCDNEDAAEAYREHNRSD